MNRRPLSEENSHLPAPVVVASPKQLSRLADLLSKQTAIAVDTESNSLYAYRERVCLIQFSTSETDYLVDPLSVSDLSPLAGIFANPEIQKVFHAAEYDVMCLKRDYGFVFANLFDTMWAARILGWPRVGLGDVLEEHFGVHTNKRYQRYNWGKRPLDQEALVYASLDTHYLLPLSQHQTEELMRQGRWEEAQEAFHQTAASEPVSHEFDPEAFRRIKGARDLTKRGQTILRELAIWRDREARHRDRPHFKVVGDQTLIALAQARPDTLDQLLGMAHLKPYHVRRYGKRILKAIKRGTRAKPSRPRRRRLRHSEAEIERFEALRAWRKQMAAERGVEPDVIMSNATLWDLAERNPETLEGLAGIEGLGTWKRQTYGETLLGILAE